jgi:hypothetical protein
MQLGPGEQDTLTLDQCFNNCLLWGQVGSGKTTGPGAHLAHGLLSHPSKPGFLVLCQKPDEGARFLRYAEQAGRLGDVLHVKPGGSLKLDILSYEIEAVGGGAEQAASLLAVLMDVANRNRARNSADSFWPDASERQMRAAMILTSMAGLSCGLREVYQFCSSLPESPAQLADPKWRKESYACNCLVAAAEEHKDDPSFRMAGDFVCGEWPALSDRTRSVISAVSTLTLDRLLTSKFAPLICDDTTWKPDEVIRDGKILIFDIPGAVHGLPAQLASVAVKTLFQRAALRRPLTDDARPFCMFIDEAAGFCVPDIDALFLSQSRQFRCICVSLVQNLPLVVTALGATEAARHQASAWISNHGTIIGCANSDPETNKMLSALAGEEREVMFGGSSGNSQPFDLVGDFLGQQQGHAHASWSEQYRPALPPERFLTLRKGGKQHGMIVDAFVFQSGRVFASSGRTWTRGTWKQRV